MCNQIRTSPIASRCHLGKFAACLLYVAAGWRGLAAIFLFPLKSSQESVSSLSLLECAGLRPITLPAVVPRRCWSPLELPESDAEEHLDNDLREV